MNFRLIRSLAVVLALVAAPGVSWAGDEEENPKAALAEAAASKAESLEASAEWRAASWAWGKAWELAPEEPEYGLRSGVAAHQAGDCARAYRILVAYMQQSEDKKGRKEAEDTLRDVHAANCGTPEEEQAMELAKTLYELGQSEAAAENWETAMYAYEDAYFLVPAKTGFAFKVGQSAYEAGRCDKAEEYLVHFRQYGDREKHVEMLAQADTMLNRLETMGCDQQAPPPVAKKGCSVSGEDLGTGGAPVLAGLMLLGLHRRRRRD